MASRTRVLQLSLAAVLSAFAVELAFGLASGSLALITDGVHALFDAVVTVMLLVAVRMAARPPDAEHTYGHGKIEALGAMMGGIAILLVACLFVYESASRIQAPPPAAVPGLFAVIGGLYAMGAGAFRVVVLRRADGGAAVRADYYHALMDTGATGVAVAGIALASYGIHGADPAAALVLGALLAALSVRLVHRTAMELTDVIPPEMVRDVRGIALGTPGVVGAGPVLMRRSGDTVFADVTISLRGDTSFEAAHETSSRVEGAIRDRIPGAAVTVHFEPDWEGVSPDARILEAARGVDGVRGVHNVGTHRAGGGTFADLHVMVDCDMSLEEAHGISDTVERRIRDAVPGIEHATVHLEPFVAVPEGPGPEDAGVEGMIRSVLEGRGEVRSIGRIVSREFGGVQKIDIDCSFDGGLPIERVHDITSEIEQQIRARAGDSVITIHPEPA